MLGLKCPESGILLQVRKVRGARWPALLKWLLKRKLAVKKLNKKEVLVKVKVRKWRKLMGVLKIQILESQNLRVETRFLQRKLHS